MSTDKNIQTLKMTPRRMQIIKLADKSRREIAETLGIGMDTVRDHLQVLKMAGVLRSPVANGTSTKRTTRRKPKIGQVIKLKVKLTQP